MPQFLMAVGLTYRLTFMRRLNGDNPASAMQHALSRNLGLLLFGFVFHGLDGSVSSYAELLTRGWRVFIPTAFERNLFGTLTIIAVTSLWVLPVIGKSVWMRVYWMIFSVALWLFFGLVPAPWSGATFVDFALNRPVMDGGPLGFLTWTVPLLVGSIAFDWLSLPSGSSRRMILTGLGLSIAGYAISCVGQRLDHEPASGWSILPRFLSRIRPARFSALSLAVRWAALEIKHFSYAQYQRSGRICPASHGGFQNQAVCTRRFTSRLCGDCIRLVFRNHLGDLATPRKNQNHHQALT